MPATQPLVGDVDLPDERAEARTPSNNLSHQVLGGIGLKDCLGSDLGRCLLIRPIVNETPRSDVRFDLTFFVEPAFT